MPFHIGGNTTWRRSRWNWTTHLRIPTQSNTLRLLNRLDKRVPTLSPCLCQAFSYQIQEHHQKAIRARFCIMLRVMDLSLCSMLMALHHRTSNPWFEVHSLLFPSTLFRKQLPPPLPPSLPRPSASCSSLPIMISPNTHLDQQLPSSSTSLLPPPLFLCPRTHSPGLISRPKNSQPDSPNHQHSPSSPSILPLPPSSPPLISST